MEHGFSKARQGWHICRIVIHKRTSSVRSDIIGNMDGICRPAGAEIYFGLGFYKYAAPDGAGSAGFSPLQRTN
jgi:hypothetical protein